MWGAWPKPVWRAWLWQAFTRGWYSADKSSSVSLREALVFPASKLVSAIALRRHKRRIVDRKQMPPIVVVGNMVAGGGGKTPLIVHLCESLKLQGHRPAILAHGYGAAIAQASLVLPDSNPLKFSDEAVMLAQQTNVPVYVAPTRLEAYALIKQNLAIDIVLCDDGLQHVQLPRAFEIACFDIRGVGNGKVLPAGPLREPIQCALSVDAIVTAATSPVAHAHVFQSRTISLEVRRVTDRNDADGYPSLAQWAKGQKHIHAVAGIANPETFFAQLDAVGLEHTDHPLRDHAWPNAMLVSDLKAQCVLMTEKDAVKWQQIIRSEGLIDPNWFALRIKRDTTPDLAQLIERTLFEPETN